jgi:hypothetical protein
MHWLRVWPFGLRVVAGAIVLTATTALLADNLSETRKTAPVDAKAAALARVSARKALNQAVAALTKEYEAHQNNPATPLRDKANFFQENPAPAITPDAVLSALDDAYGPPAEDCYIKWQLLAALPAKADEQTASRIGALYENAPDPIPNPSLTSTDKSHLDAQMRRLTAEQEGTVNDAWKKHLDDWEAANAPILAYNNSLFAMLPESLGATTLGLQDAYRRRAAAGVDCEDFLNDVISAARDWAVTATPDQLRATAAQFARYISLYSKTFPPSVYVSVKWDQQGRQLRWEAKGIRCVSADTLTAFKKFLIDQANAPSGGISIKSSN